MHKIWRNNGKNEPTQIKAQDFSHLVDELIMLHSSVFQ